MKESEKLGQFELFENMRKFLNIEVSPQVRDIMKFHWNEPQIYANQEYGLWGLEFSDLPEKLGLDKDKKIWKASSIIRWDSMMPDSKKPRFPKGDICGLYLEFCLGWNMGHNYKWHGFLCSENVKFQKGEDKGFYRVFPQFHSLNDGIHFHLQFQYIKWVYKEEWESIHKG